MPKYSFYGGHCSKSIKIPKNLIEITLYNVVVHFNTMLPKSAIKVIYVHLAFSQVRFEHKFDFMLYDIEHLLGFKVPIQKSIFTLS